MAFMDFEKLSNIVPLWWLTFNLEYLGVHSSPSKKYPILLKADIAGSLFQEVSWSVLPFSGVFILDEPIAQCSL